MDKQHILDDIRRTAAANGGKPLGRERFASDTGIKPHHWMKFWSRFGDAQREAGFAPNQKTRPYNEDLLLRHVALIARELGRFPTFGDLRVGEQDNPAFPSAKTIQARFGSKSQLVQKVTSFCTALPEFADVLAMCAVGATYSTARDAKEEIPPNTARDGFVYLLKSGRYYKIGRTNALGRREYEIGLQLPDAAKTVHTIKTDDPVGIEAYWHKRFEGRRKNGEWFELTREDVAAFRRRKFM